MNSEQNKGKENRGYQPKKGSGQFGYQPKKIETQKKGDSTNNSKIIVPPKGTKGEDA